MLKFLLVPFSSLASINKLIELYVIKTVLFSVLLLVS